MINILVGRTIAELRWARGMPPMEFCGKAGITEQLLLEIEVGSIDVDLLTLNNICSVLGISLNELFSLPQCSQAETGLKLNGADLNLTSTPPKPTTLEEYRLAGDWYSLRKRQFDWIARQQHAKQERLRASLMQLRNVRNRIYESRRARLYG